jgi:hypothetical protein
LKSCRVVEDASAGIQIALRWCAAAAASLALCSGLAASAQAAPVWVSQGKLSNPQTEVASAPTAALDAGGGATLGWVDNAGSVFDLLATGRPAGGAWGTPNQLSGLLDFDPTNPRQLGPQIVDDGQGDAAAVWDQAGALSHSAVKVSVRTPMGIWGAPETVSPTTGAAHDPVIAINAAGTVLVAWIQDGVINTRTRALSGTWSAASGLGGGVRPAVAIDGRGDLVTVWETDPNAPTRSVMASTKRSDGDWGLAQTVASYSTNDAFGGPPRVALDPAGDATAIWDLYPGPLETSTRSLGGSWSAPLTLAQYGDWAEIAYDANGNATAMWTTGYAGSLQTRWRPRGGPWSPTTVTLGEYPIAPSERRPALAANSAGQAVAAWGREPDPLGPAIFAAVSDGHGAWSSATQLSDDGARNAAAWSVAAAIDDSGDALVIWSDVGTINASAYDQTGPKLQDLTIPSTGVAGSPVGVSVRPLDTWTTVTSTVWDFGDGTVASGSTLTHTFSAAGRHVIRVSATDALGNVTSRAASIDVANAPPPTVATGAAQSVHRTSATITATINPDGQPTSFYFDWGQSQRYGHPTREIFLGSDNRRHAVAATLSKLRQGTTYHYRVAARCEQICGYETAYGTDGVFTTLPARVVSATFLYDGLWRRRYGVFTNLTIKGIPNGGGIELRCDGRGCPFARRAFRARGHADLASRLQRRHLAIGTRLQARILKKGWTSKVFVFHLRANRKPRVDVLCLRPGARHPTSC